MTVLYIALPIAILLGASGMIACVYCIRSGQFDDLDGPSVRILVDEKPCECETVEPSGIHLSENKLDRNEPSG